MIYGYLSGSVNPGSAGQFIYTSAVCAVCAVIAVFLYECGFRAATGKSPENSLLRSAFCGKNIFCMAVTAFFGYCGLTPRRNTFGLFFIARGSVFLPCRRRSVRRVVVWGGGIAVQFRKRVVRVFFDFFRLSGENLRSGSGLQYPSCSQSCRRGCFVLSHVRKT